MAVKLKDIRIEEKMERQDTRRGNGRGRDRPGRKGTGRNRPGHDERRSMTPVLALLVLLLLAALAAAAYFYIQGRDKAPQTEGLVYEANIVEGDIPGKSQEERQRELDAMVEEGMLAMSINATPFGRVSGAEQDINWMIENPSNQGKLIRVEIWRDDTGEKIYETGAIPPGNYVESAPLKEKLTAGEYSCTARFYAYREEDEAYIGQAGAQIKLTLQE